MRARPGIGLVAAALLLVPSGCGGGDSDPEAHEGDAGEFSAAADTDTCVKDATAVASMPHGYPTSFPLPAGTVVFNVEDRGDDGVIATGVTATRFDDVLAAMNATQDAGFDITGGETEEDDAEANWTGNGYVGRWTIKRSRSCPAETVIQLLSKAD